MMRKRCTSYIPYHGMNGKTTYEVDALGRITSVTDAMNRTVSYKWNGNGEKSQIIYADGSTVDYKSIYLFNFDETNRMVSSKNALGIETNYCYDGNGTRISKTVNFPKNANGLKASMSTMNHYYGYDKGNHQYEILFDRPEDASDFFYWYIRINGCNFNLGLNQNRAYAANEEEAMSKIVKIAEFCQRFLTEFEPVLTEMFGKTPDWYHYDE